MHIHIHEQTGASPGGSSTVHVLMNKDYLPITLEGKLVAYVHASRAQGLVDSLRVLRANEDPRLPFKIFEVRVLCIASCVLYTLHAYILTYIHTYKYTYIYISVFSVVYLLIDQM